MAITEKEIDKSVITQLQARNLMNNLLEGKYSTISDRLYKMENANILLAPIEKNGFIKYDQELDSNQSHYNDHYTKDSVKKIDHYLNFLELVTYIHNESTVLFQVFNNGKVKQDLMDKNFKYLESVQLFREKQFNGKANNGFPEPPNAFTLQDFFKYAFKNDLPTDKKDFLPLLISEYFTLDEIVIHGNFTDKQNLKTYIEPDLLDIVIEIPCFSELHKIKTKKIKAK